MSNVALGFELNPILVFTEKILPSRKTPIAITTSRKYSQIRSSIEEIGLIEPLSVRPAIAETDDESYTYNSRINRLSSIQEHYMICRAIERGVTVERLSKALNLNPCTIERKATLLVGICPEAVEMLKDHQFSTDLVRVLRKMKPTRQIECVELMVSANNITVAYLEAMLVATPAAMLVEGKKPKKLSGISSEQMAKMEREMSNLQNQYKMVEQTYGQDVLNLVLAKGYLTKLLENPSVARYLQQKYSELLAAFEGIIQTVSLDQ
jgi:RepB plasmid partitioning protein